MQLGYSTAPYNCRKTVLIPPDYSNLNRYWGKRLRFIEAKMCRPILPPNPKPFRIELHQAMRLRRSNSVRFSVLPTLAHSSVELHFHLDSDKSIVSESWTAVPYSRFCIPVLVLLEKTIFFCGSFTKFSHHGVICEVQFSWSPSTKENLCHFLPVPRVAVVFCFPSYCSFYVLPHSLSPVRKPPIPGWTKLSLPTSGLPWSSRK